MSTIVLERVNPSSLGSSLLTPNVPLADKTWFKTGGAARYYAEPKTAQEFQEVLSAALSQDLPIGIIGDGANMLISDDGFDGLIIRPRLSSIKRHDYDEQYVNVEAQAGVLFSDLIVWCLENNILGLEEFSGIPGTVGGSVFINIHYFEFLLSQYLVSAQVIEKKTGLLKVVDNEWFKFGYNTSRLHDGTHYLVGATFKLKKCSAEEAAHALGRSQEIIRHRAQRYPNSNTCGSFFRNFTPKEVEHTSKKLIYVAYYLDKLGIKGELSVGGAIVSYKHANMIVNSGTATSLDIVNLARTMQEMVKNQFGIIPQPECRFVGFKEYPLLS